MRTPMMEWLVPTLARAIATALVIVSASLPVFAIENTIAPRDAWARPTGKTLHAIRAPAAPRIDGALDDAVWRDARFVDDFLQKEPTYGASPSRRTEVALAYDDTALYVAARMYAHGPADIQAVMTRRDVTGSAERIIVSFDPFLDRRTAYSFAVTAAGVRADWQHTDDSEYQRDSSFDPVWSARVSTDADGWYAEMRIPFTQLRFPRGAEQRWGININRYIPQRNEDIFWIPIPREETAWASHFGELTGLSDMPQPTRVEVVPYVTGDMTLASEALVAQTGGERLGAGVRAGGDLTMGLGSNGTLNATVLPDFGQVEADPAEVNLSAFETFFSERRPFFTQGNQLLQGDGPAFYYSRRIGAPPRGCTNEYEKCPDDTPILAAAQVTGRLPSKLSLGALAAITGRADALDPVTGEAVRVAPLAGQGVLRVQREFGRDASLVGASLTGVTRDIDPAEPLAARFVRHALTGGVDFKLRFDRATHELFGSLGFSHLSGEPQAIQNLVTNPVHYFQRPDQSHISLDPTRRTLSGAVGFLGLGKRSGNWQWQLASSFETPGYDPNELGQLQSADDISLGGQASYRHTRPGRAIHSWRLSVGGYTDWNFSGARDPGYVYAQGGLVLPNFWEMVAQVGAITPGQSDHATRGGPLMGVGPGTETGLAVASPYAGRYRWNGEFVHVAHPTGESGWYVNNSLTLQPLDRLSIALAPRYKRTTDRRQYVDTIDGAYIFGTIERREISVQTRVQVAFTPDLTLDAYLEPFAASGRFLEFGDLAAPGSRELLPRAPGPETQGLDFTFLSLRSTAVLRWEFSPGSTLFFVLQQNRSDRRDTPMNVWRNLGDGFTVPGSTTVAIKLSYWLTMDRVRSLWR